jgi:hypothetical protein
MLTLFPDTPDAALLHRISPWWCTLHYLMQAATVLLLELAYRAQHVPEKAIMVSKAAKKALDWLSTLSKSNMASERAWKLCNGFLRRLVPHVGIDVDDFSGSDNEESSATSLLDATDLADAAALELDQTVQDISFDPSVSLPAAPASTAAEIAAEMDSLACSPMDQASTPIAMPVSCNLEPDLLEFIKPETSISGRSPYDNYFPYDPATGQMTGSFFPTGSNMDFDLGYSWPDPVC